MPKRQVSLQHEAPWNYAQPAPLVHIGDTSMTTGTLPPPFAPGPHHGHTAQRAEN